MEHRDGQWLGAEAARRLAKCDGLEARPPRADVEGTRAQTRLTKLRGVVIQPALTDAEIRRTEDRFGFEFADDHRALLSAGLPTGEHWPDWRGGNADDLRKALSWPVTGVLFDVENNAFWDCRWGERPADNAGAVKLAAAALADAPQMVPVYSHRYLPAGRETFGHPVLSIHQTDVICYGTDLVDYVFQEFGVGPGIERSDPRWRPRPTVAFWSDLLE